MRAYIRVENTKFPKINFQNSIFDSISENYSFQKLPAIQYKPSICKANITSIEHKVLSGACFRHFNLS